MLFLIQIYLITIIFSDESVDFKNAFDSIDKELKKADSPISNTFDSIDKELEEIRDILRSASITQDELLDLQRKIDVISNRTTDTTDQLDG